MSDILSGLNDVQRQAAEAVTGPVMIIAGAGSGKTRVITYRIAHMLELGIPSRNILALTFTNKAAKEMKTRIANLIGEAEARDLWMGTFHSVFRRVLAREADSLGFPKNFTIYDTEDSHNLLKRVVKSMNLDPKIYTPKSVLARISMAKSNLLSHNDYLNNSELRISDRRANKPYIGEIFKQYDEELFRSAAMDFDDLLFYMNVLLRDNPEALFKYQNVFKYIMVDEYQDTNHAQYVIVRKLASRFRNICVVGDDAQSIYAFRGATIENILRFAKDYPETQQFKLEQNYRSTKCIVDAANNVIRNNNKQLKKQVWTANEAGDKINIIRAASDKEEGRIIGQTIYNTHFDNGVPFADMVILYRTNGQSRMFEDALRRLAIPCVIYGGVSFYKRKEVKDLLAYFRLATNFRDEEALVRVINYPQRGIGDLTVGKVRIQARQRNTTMWDLIADENNLNSLDITDKTKRKLNDFATLIKDYHVQLPITDAFELAKYIANTSGILKDLFDNAEERDRYENVEELLGAVKEFTEREPGNVVEETGEIVREMKTLDTFLNEVSLLSDTDEEKNKEQKDSVTLMTIHSAKGLEFPYVYVVGLEENLFPSALSLGSSQDLEEERRLFYVAVTRAKEHLTLSFADSRFLRGSINCNDHSRFLEEVGEDNMTFVHGIKRRLQRVEGEEERPKGLRFTTPENRISGMNKFVQRPTTFVRKKEENITPTGGELIPIGDIHVGMRVMHKKFGVGKVLQIEGEGASKKAVIFFQEAGQKTMMLSYAQLRRVE